MPAVALCLFAGYALLGLHGAGATGSGPRCSAAAAVVGAIGLIILAPSLTNVREELRFIRATHDSLIATLDDPEVRAGMRCGTLTFPTYRLVPDARWHLPDARIGARSARRRDAASRSSRSARRPCAATGSRRARRRGSTCRVPATRPSRGTAF